MLSTHFREHFQTPLFLNPTSSSKHYVLFVCLLPPPSLQYPSPRSNLTSIQKPRIPIPNLINLILRLPFHQVIPLKRHTCPIFPSQPPAHGRIYHRCEAHQRQCNTMSLHISRPISSGLAMFLERLDRSMAKYLT